MYQEKQNRREREREREMTHRLMRKELWLQGCQYQSRESVCMLFTKSMWWKKWQETPLGKQVLGQAPVYLSKKLGLFKFYLFFFKEMQSHGEISIMGNEIIRF